MLQAQKETQESELRDENADTVVFHTKNKPYKTLIVVLPALYKPLLIISIVVETLALLLGLLAHAHTLLLLFVTTAPILLLAFFILRWCITRLNGPLGNPTLQLSPEGMTLHTEPFLGTVPWDEIASVEAGSLMGMPTVIVKPRDRAALQARLGKRGRYLWMYAMPGGGLGFPCLQFGLSPDDLAARINRYHERGL